MPETATLKRARKDKAEGKSASTQAGEFVKEEMDHIREGKHGARSPEQAIAIGLSKARRAGVELLPAPKEGKTSAATRKKATQDLHKGKSGKEDRSANPAVGQTFKSTPGRAEARAHLRNTRKTVAVSAAPPKGLASSFLPWRRAAAPLRFSLEIRTFQTREEGRSRPQEARQSYRRFTRVALRNSLL